MYHRLGSDYYLGEDKMALDEGAVYEERLALLEPYRGASRLLDVGCSTGAFLSSARRKGWLVRGVELSLPAAQYASEVRKLDVFCGALAEARYPDGSFDVVNLWAVLEHVLNPVELISEIGRVLRPGGLLVFCVPNFDSLPIRLLGVRYRYICGGHLFYFTEKSVRFMLAQCGFLPVKISSEYFSPFTLAEDFWGCRPETAKTEKKEKAAVSLLRNRPSVNWALKWGWKSAMAAIRRWGLGEELRCLAVKNRKK
jgi:SAM-dependent methyltransferase